jgi:hypothetical protein
MDFSGFLGPVYLISPGVFPLTPYENSYSQRWPHNRKLEGIETENGGRKQRAAAVRKVPSRFPMRSAAAPFFHRGRELSALILALCDFCHAVRRIIAPAGGHMAECDLTAREDRFIGLCLGAVAIILLFVFIVS